MACKYCYHDGRPRVNEKQSRMSVDLLRKLIKDSAELASDIDFVWHGGEPLLAGMEHFKTAIDIQRKTCFSGRVRNIIQTNGVLLNKSWCRFLSLNHFIISTSLDGPAEINDANRLLLGGGKTYHRVARAVRLWKQTGNQMGAVALVTRTNVRYPAETYRGLKRVGFKSCAFHVCSQNDDQSVDLVPSAEEAAYFLKSVFDLWFEEDDPTFLIRNFRNVLRVLCGGVTIDCASRVDGCWGFIAVTANGDVYPCHRFVNRTNFRLGNILEESLSALYKKGYSLYRAMCSLPEECERCEWINVCGGGCAYERIVVNGSFQSIHPACEVKKELFAHIKIKTNELIKK
ncbi:MAG: anaerobic sulfatase maturase [Candidatus Parcubacteria bacterium]|nr:MAG: anaerobic sulfatase maturase [Candidatus Parcubacteria bacterium]